MYNGKPQKAAEAALWYKHGLFQTMLWQYIPAFASSTHDMCKSLGEGMLVGHIYQQGGGGTPTQANVVLPAFGVSKMVPKVMWEAFWSAKAGNQRCGTSKDKMKRSLEKHILKEGEKGLKKEMLKPLKKELSKKLLEIVVSDLPGVGQVASAIPKAYNILTQDTVHKSVSHTIKLCQQEKFGDTSWWESPSMRGKEWRDLKERTAVLTAAAKWSFLHQSLQFIDGVLGSIARFFQRMVKFVFDGILNIIWGTVKMVAKAAFNILPQPLQSLLAWVWSCVLWVWNAIWSIFTFLWSLVAWVWSCVPWVWNAIWSIFTFLWSLVPSFG